MPAALSHAPAARVRGWLRAAHPGVRISITPAEPPLLERLDERAAPRPGLTETAAPLPGVRVEPVLQADEVAVLPAGHPLAAKPRLALKDFAGQDFVSLAPDDPYRREIDARFEAAGVQRRLGVQTHSAVAVCAMVARPGAGHRQPADGGRPGRGPGRGAGGIVVRPLTVSIPYRVSALRPLHRAGPAPGGRTAARARRPST